MPTTGPTTRPGACVPSVPPVNPRTSASLALVLRQLLVGLPYDEGFGYSFQSLSKIQ